ncbi:hypothetical protein CEXT_600721 [Caerostris extrusa]|uniref:Uncharacterized protein n=1 Tax=Caerostris extrusa TaxID=172846 RepID=A0AAV4NIK4_CAEEX|nr:hypothetical protein CEXT_600721 [Caerostris extrusa]
MSTTNDADDIENKSFANFSPLNSRQKSWAPITLHLRKPLRRGAALNVQNSRTGLKLPKKRWTYISRENTEHHILHVNLPAGIVAIKTVKLCLPEEKLYSLFMQRSETKLWSFTRNNDFQSRALEVVDII